MFYSKHKRHYLILLSLLLTFCFFPLKASNLQRSYGTHTPQWQQTMAICRLSGVVGPSASGPVTARELIIALNRVDSSKLSNSAQIQYFNLLNSLQSPKTLYSTDDFSFSLYPLLSLEGYAQSGGSSTTLQNWVIPYRDRLPFLDIGMNITVAENFYGFFSYMLKAQNSNFLAAKPFSTNLSGGFIQIQTMQPFTVGIVAGGNTWNISVARDRLSIGNGYTGNLFVGDNFSYQEYVKFTLATNPFTYSFIITHFDQQSDKTTLVPFRFSGYHQQRISHRFSINFFNKITFSVTDNTLFQTQSAFDIRMLNPFMFLHNYNNFQQSAEILDGDEANNFTGFELEYAVFPGWNITAQGILDQIQTKEEQSNDNTNIYPNAWEY